MGKRPLRLREDPTTYLRPLLATLGGIAQLDLLGGGGQVQAWNWIFMTIRIVRKYQIRLSMEYKVWSQG